MSSFQGVAIEEFHCIQRVSSFQGVGIEEFHLYTEVSSFQGVGIGVSLLIQVSAFQVVGMRNLEVVATRTLTDQLPK